MLAGNLDSRAVKYMQARVTVMVSGKRGTVAEISNARAKSLYTRELCHIFARQIL